jgi:ATP-dependent Clp protease protease subunit
MIHEPTSFYYDEQAGECIMEVKEVLKLHDCITKVYVQRMGQPLWIIFEDMEIVIFMSTKRSTSLWYC